MKRFTYILLLLPLLLASCGEYQKLLKSKDPEAKYEAALKYFDAGQYVKSQTLLDDVSAYYKGTERAQEVIIYLARSYMGQKSWQPAADYFQAYLRNYPKGSHAAEAAFQSGHCYYLDAPDARLDQDVTVKAIDAFQHFIDTYPDNSYVQQAYKEQNEMYDRLAYKELLNARLYYNLGTYLGNNYLSCEITAKNALKDYPSNAWQEELNWLIMASKYQQMNNSLESRKQERAREADDEYYSFVTSFPDSKHKREAERMHKDIQKILKKD